MGCDKHARNLVTNVPIPRGRLYLAFAMFLLRAVHIKRFSEASDFHGFEAISLGTVILFTSVIFQAIYQAK